MGGGVDVVGVVGSSKVVVYCNADAGFGLDKVGCVRCDFEEHVSGVETYDGVRVCVELVH